MARIRTVLPIELREEMLTVEQMAHELGLKPQSLRKRVMLKRIPYVQWGWEIYFMRLHIPVIRLGLM